MRETAAGLLAGLPSRMSHGVVSHVMLSRGSFTPMSSTKVLPQSDAPVAAGLGSPDPAMLGRLLPQVTLADGPHQAITVRAPYTGAAIGTIPAGTVADLELRSE